MKRILPLAVSAGLGLLALACAKEPTADVTAAENAVAVAQDAGAPEYAPEAMDAALTAQAALESELRLQAGRLAFLRSYGKTATLAAALRTSADAAATQAVSGKERTKNDVIALLAGVRASVVTAKQALAGAPKGLADLGTMHSDVAIVEASLPSIDEAFSTGRYREAKAKAQAAKDTLDRIISGTKGGGPYTAYNTLNPPV